MLLMLMMLPVPRATMPGANAATRKNGALTLAANRIEGRDLKCLRGSPHREPGVVDQDVDVANLLGETGDARGVGEVGGDEVRATALQLDFFDRLDTALRVAAMHSDVGAIPRELKGDRATQAGCCSRDQRFQAMQRALLSVSHHPLLFADFSCCLSFADRQVGVVENEGRTP